MSNWEQFFKTRRDCSVRCRSWGIDFDCTVEELYQAFKERMQAEAAASAQEAYGSDETLGKRAETCPHGVSHLNVCFKCD